MFTNTESADSEFLRALRGSHLVLQPAGGNVGIGITSPTARLHISENGGSTDDAFVVDPSNGGNRTMTIDGQKN